MSIQDKLNQIGYGREFTVRFTKVDGTERVLTGFLEVPTKPVDYLKAVPMKITKGDEAGQWRSFKPESVLEISTEG